MRFFGKLLSDYIKTIHHFFIYSFVGYEKIAKMLIEKGANINAVNEDNNSPLLWAVFAGDC